MEEQTPLTYLTHSIWRLRPCETLPEKTIIRTQGLRQCRALNASPSDEVHKRQWLESLLLDRCSDASFAVEHPIFGEDVCDALATTL
jgi:hypothetical protein